MGQQVAQLHDIYDDDDELGWHPVAIVQYTCTHKQYIERHSETEYTEENIHNNKNK